MKNKIKTIGIIVCLTLFSMLITISLIPSGETALPRKAVKLVLNQNNEGKLSIGEIQVVDVYPQDYKLNLINDYYTIRIFDEVDKILFAGKETYKDIKVFSILPGREPLPETVSMKEKMALFLPYYHHAKKIGIYDEKDNLKIDIPLESYQLTPGTMYNLCGNGICDANENMFGCFSDCKFYIDIFKDIVTNKLIP